MPSGWQESKYTPIGLDVRQSGVYAVQFARQGSDWRLHAVASAPVLSMQKGTAGSSPLIDAVKSALAAQPFKGATVVTSIPNGEIEMRRVLLPEGITAEPGAQTRAAVMAEARSMLIYRPEDAVIDYIPLENTLVDGKRRDSVLMVAAKRVNVNRHLASLKAAGLSCAYADIGPFAAMRVLGATDDTYAVVDVDNDQCMLSVSQGRKVLFGRTFRCGWLNFVDAICRQLDVSKGDAYRMLKTYGFAQSSMGNKEYFAAQESGALGRQAIPAALMEVCKDAFDLFSAEIVRSISYFRMHYLGAKIKRVLLLGPVLPQRIEHVLSDKLALPVLRASAFNGAAPAGRTSEKDSTAFVVAAGLAKRGVTS